MLLVSPTATWGGQVGGPLPALVTQALLLMLGWSAASHALADLSKVSGLAEGGTGFTSFLLLLAALLVLTLLLTAAATLLLRALGSKQTFGTMFTWLAYGMTPVYLGRSLGLLTFAIVQPLAADPREALALQVNPLGLSLAGLYPPLSFPWTLAASIDVFTVWALVLLAIGALHYLKLGTARSAALMSALLIIWLLALTAVWQGLQRSL